MGVDPSSVLLYPQTKGQIERELARMGFAELAIFRPGMLVGRPKGGRWAEELAGWLVPFGSWVAPRKLSVSCAEVARAMVQVASADPATTAATTATTTTTNTTNRKDRILHRPPLDQLWGVKAATGEIRVFNNEDITYLAEQGETKQ